MNLIERVIERIHEIGHPIPLAEDDFDLLLPEPESPAVPQPKEPRMNATWTTVENTLPMLVKAVQPSTTNADGSPMTGADKAAAVIGGIAAIIPDEISPLVPEIKLGIAALVAMFNTFHPLFKKPTTVTAQATSAAATAATVTDAFKVPAASFPLGSIAPA